MTIPPIPVICDRCRAEGVAGQDDFADFGDLLDFAPVPLQVDRVDGFSPEVQRAFIAALSVLGSADRAAKAIGKSATGAERLRRLPGSESFCRAWARAKAISQQKGTLRLADSLRGVVHPPDPAPEQEPEPTGAERAEADRVMDELLDVLVRKYLRRLRLERRARLEGRIAEADLYVRQITCLEVSLDMLSGDGMAILRDFRCRGDDLLHIAETPMSKLLDEARRLHWDECGEPPRPGYPPLHLLIQQQGFAVERLDSISNGHPDGLTHKEQQRLIDERNARDAEAQVAWEAEAREAAAAWRERLEAEETAARPPAEDSDEEPRP